MRLCKSAILVSFTSTGAGVRTVGEADLPVACGFFPPVSHMMTTMSRAMPMITQDWTFFGSRPGGFGALSLIGSFMAFPSRKMVRAEFLFVSREGDLFLADREVPAVDDFGNDVHAVLDLEIDQVWFAVFHFVKRRLFAGSTLDVSECVVVVNRVNEKRFSRSFGVKLIVKVEFPCIF